MGLERGAPSASGHGPRLTQHGFEFDEDPIDVRLVDHEWSPDLHDVVIGSVGPRQNPPLAQTLDDLARLCRCGLTALAGFNAFHPDEEPAAPNVSDHSESLRQRAQTVEQPLPDSGRSGL